MNIKYFYSAFKFLKNYRHIVALGMIIVLLIVITDLMRTCNGTISNGMKGAKELVGSFRTGDVTTTFISAIPEVISTNGDILELSTHKSTETFRRKEESKIMWGIVDLGDNVVEIRTPVTYRYHLKLSDPWKVEIRGNECIVHSPRIRPSLPPAIHTDEMEKYVLKQGWARFDASQTLERLQRELTPELSRRASDEKYISLVKDKCRQSVAAFVKNWLIKKDWWEENKVTSIQVIFPGENNINNNLEIREKTNN